MHDEAEGRMVHMIVLPSNGRLAEDADQWRSHARVKGQRTSHTVHDESCLVY